MNVNLSKYFLHTGAVNALECLITLIQTRYPQTLEIRNLTDNILVTLNSERMMQQAAKHDFVNEPDRDSFQLMLKAVEKAKGG